MSGFDIFARPEEWTRDAACARTSPDAFFPQLGNSAQPAIRVCRRCPVITECLAYAMSKPHMLGVWGGMSERARRDLRTRIRNEEVA